MSKQEEDAKVDKKKVPLEPSSKGIVKTNKVKVPDAFKTGKQPTQHGKITIAKKSSPLLKKEKKLRSSNFTSGGNTANQV